MWELHLDNADKHLIQTPFVLPTLPKLKLEIFSSLLKYLYNVFNIRSVLGFEPFGKHWNQIR
jgi:hypothetical protein